MFYNTENKTSHIYLRNFTVGTFTVWAIKCCRWIQGLIGIILLRRIWSTIITNADKLSNTNCNKCFYLKESLGTVRSTCKRWIRSSICRRASSCFPRFFMALGRTDGLDPARGLLFTGCRAGLNDSSPGLRWLGSKLPRCPLTFFSSAASAAGTGRLGGPPSGRISFSTGGTQMDRPRIWADML